MMQKIIGLLGVKGSGKDTAAQFLMDHRQFVRIGFADALYIEAATAFGVSVPFLNNRDTKETNLPELALNKCFDKVYVACVAHAISPDAPLTEEQLAAPRSPRFILQLWGTEYRRKGAPGIYVGEDAYWLNKVKAAILAQPDRSFVVTDVRFLNEFAFVRAQGGTLVRIRRPALEAQEAIERAKSGSAAHPSETELLTVPVDYSVVNQEGLVNSLLEPILSIADRKVATAA